MMAIPLFRVAEVAFFEREVVLRLPFRFGMATLTRCPQAFARVRIEFADGASAHGCAAEMMVPKWFDKNPALSNEDNFEQLRQALRLARDAYCGDCGSRSGWQHFATHYAAILDAGRRHGLEPLVSCYGPALLDRAILDALCRHAALSFSAAMRGNLCGIGHGLGLAQLAPDLAGFDIDALLAQRPSPPSIAARHTVGLADAIRDSDAGPDAPQDGLPVSLQGAIARYGHRHFKLKLNGQLEQDLARLQQIAAVIQGAAQCITLDGNEQYPDAQAFAEFLDRFHRTPALAPLARRVAFVEQPIHRSHALERDMHSLAQRTPLLIDESDATLDAFPQAMALGYTGVSSKNCKGFYKSILNLARCQLRNAQAGGEPRYFLSGEDLTTQAGLSVQQDLALVALLGLTHVERNGHHYVNGMAALPAAEQQAFLHAYPRLYEESDGAVRLRIRDGQIDLTDLDQPGFASAAQPDWAAMRPFT